MDPNRDEDDSFKNKLRTSFQSWKYRKNIEEGYNYAKKHNRDTIAFILLLIGLLLLFFEPWYGGTLIGVIFGLYFSQEVVDVLTNHVEIIDRLGIPRSMVLICLLLAFFISAPFIFIGAAVAVSLRHLS